jgi:hypothetical protein
LCFLIYHQGIEKGRHLDRCRLWYLQSRATKGPGRNPQTGEEIDIKASNAPKFTAGKALKSAVN